MISSQVEAENCCSTTTASSSCRTTPTNTPRSVSRLPATSRQIQKLIRQATLTALQQLDPPDPYPPPATNELSKYDQSNVFCDSQQRALSHIATTRCNNPLSMTQGTALATPTMIPLPKPEMADGAQAGADSSSLLAAPCLEQDMERTLCTPTVPIAEALLPSAGSEAAVAFLGSDQMSFPSLERCAHGNEVRAHCADVGVSAVSGEQKSSEDHWWRESASFTAIGRYIVEKHGSQLPYDRHLWGTVWRRHNKSEQSTSNGLFSISNEPRHVQEAFYDGVKRLRQFIYEIRVALDVLFTASSYSFPSDANADALSGWLDRQSLTVDDLTVPNTALAHPDLNIDNLFLALSTGGILLDSTRQSSNRFNLLSTGKSDTKQVTLAVQQRLMTLKRSRTTLALPFQLLPLHDQIPLKIGIFQITNHLSIIIFYLGSSQQRNKNTSAGVKELRGVSLFSDCILSRSSSNESEVYKAEVEESQVDDNLLVLDPPPLMSGWHRSQRRVQELNEIWERSYGIEEGPGHRAFLLTVKSSEMFVFLAAPNRVVDDGVLYQVQSLIQVTPPSDDAVPLVPPKKRLREDDWFI